MFGQLFGNMYWKIIFFLGIDHFNRFEFAYQYTGITDLTTTFCIEWSIVKYNLIQCLVLLFDLTITKDRSFVFSVIVTNEFGRSFFQYNPVTSLDSGSITCTLFLLLHFFIELVDVDSHFVFTENQFCQVEWETECII